VSKKTARVYIETLGCPRNDCDSEAIISILEDSKFEIVNSPEEAPFIIINGCAFIEEAVSQSIESILTLSQRNPSATLIVVGCLAERYKEKLKEALPEIDILVGTGALMRIVDAIQGNKSILSSNEGFIGKNIYKKHHTTPPHYRYIKIQEGCNYECSFCIIPTLKGSSHSKPLEAIKEEVNNLTPEVREIILVGQDTSSWGQDIYGKPSLDYLLREISSLFPHWIRVLYLHPLTVSEPLLRTISTISNVLNYLDIPLQHISNSVLKAMKRGYDKSFIKKLLNSVQRIDDFTIRTTFIVGFPTEREDDLEELRSFIKNSNLDRIGLFKYSREEGSESYYMRGHYEKTIKKRFKSLYILIQKKMIKRNRELLGRNVMVLMDGREQGEYYGRTKSDAPEIDQVEWIKGNKDIKIGEFYNVNITDSLESELMGKVI